MIVVVVSRMLAGVIFVLVAVMLVLVVAVGRMLAGEMLVFMTTDVEVEVEEGGAVPPVPMPVAGGLQTETSDADNKGGCQNRPRLPGTPDHGSAEVLHVLILTDRARHPQVVFVGVCSRWTGLSPLVPAPPGRSIKSRRCS